MQWNALQLKTTTTTEEEKARLPWNHECYGLVTGGRQTLVK